MSAPSAPPAPAAPQSALPLAARWPQIHGIDADDVCERLGGDVALFGLMLRRWLNGLAAGDFAAVVIAPDASGDSLRIAHAARAHDVRGVAGLLGAAAIAQQAAVVELACRGGDCAHAAAASQQLAQQLRQLAADAAEFMAAGDTA